MDPVTQGVLGSVVAQTQGRSRDLAKAAVIGAMAGMAPDLDVLIQSADDSLLALEYHRQFTHSLLFIPVGGLLCALVLYFLIGKRWGVGFFQTLVWCILGYATHGLLDGCTSYGTLLLWPLSNQRFSWDIISIIDPLFTLPLLFLVVMASIHKSRAYIAVAIFWGTLYLTFGYIQHERAMRLGIDLAKQRNHQIMQIEAKPGFANLWVWKTIYTTQDEFYVDAVRPGISESRTWEGERIAKLDLKRDLPWLNPESVQAVDIERFRWFSSGYIALDPDNPNRVIDIRYSLLPQQIKPLWGIELSPGADKHKHAVFYSERGDSAAALKHLWGMMFK